MAILEFDTSSVYKKLCGFWVLKSKDCKQVDKEILILLKLNLPNPFFNFNGKYSEQIKINGKSVKKKVIPINFEYFHFYEELKINYLNEKTQEIFKIQSLDERELVLREINSQELFKFEREN
jgi:hypothetical protein